MRDVSDHGLFFFHNPKAGGTSIRHALETTFPPEERCPLIENSERDHQQRGNDYTGFRGYRFYSGHYGCDIFRAVADGHDAVTNFRDPASRLLSLYNFFRLEVTLSDDPVELDNHHAVAFAQQVDFHDFIATDDPRIEVYTRDHHVRQLTNSAWSADCIGDLGHAVALVEAMPWFYVCEYPELSACWGKAVFGEHLASIPRKNVTSRSNAGRVAVTTIAATTRRLISDKNALDEALYAHATRHLLRVGQEL